MADADTDMAGAAGGDDGAAAGGSAVATGKRFEVKKWNAVSRPSLGTMGGGRGKSMSTRGWGRSFILFIPRMGRSVNPLAIAVKKCCNIMPLSIQKVS